MSPPGAAAARFALRRRWAGVAAVLAGALALAAPVPASASAAAAGEVPSRFEKIWFRAEKRGAPGRIFNVSGVLEIGPEAIEIRGRKKRRRIPWREVEVVSLGKMRGDVDTDWAVLGLSGSEGGPGTVGLRDGRRLGFGTRTPEVYEALLAWARRTGQAQFRAPQGFVTYEGMIHQCTFAVPQGWTAYLESLAYEDETGPFGVLYFAEERIRHPLDEAAPAVRYEDDPETLARVLSGETAAFRVETRPVESGPGCGKIGGGERERLIEEVLAEPPFSGAEGPLREPLAEPVEVGGCEGVRIVARARDASGSETVVEQHVAVHGGIRYRFGLRAPSERLAERRAPFDAALGTVRFSAAR